MLKGTPKKMSALRWYSWQLSLAFSPGILRRCYVELEERVAGHECHLVEFGHVPCAHDDAAAVRVAFERVDDLLNLVDVAAVWGGPAAPLHAVHGAKVAVFTGPLVPNGDIAFFEPVVIARTRQEPQQLLNDGTKVDLFRGDEGKAFVQVKSHLVTKHAFGTCAGAIGLGNPMVVHVLHEIFVLTADGAHKGNWVKN